MADDVLVNNLTTDTAPQYNVSTDEVIVNGAGGLAHVQHFKLVDGTENGTAGIPGDAANGLDVDVTRLPALAAGANVIGSLAANQSVNAAQINGVTPLMGAGAGGTGSLRVNIATDQLVIPVSDNAGSLTVDAPVATPLAARLSDGAAFLTTTSGRLAVDGSGVTQPVSGTVTANQGTPNTAANKWPVSVTDGTSTSAVKAASTAAVAADPALVVAHSPNSPTPAGTATIGGVLVQGTDGVTSNLTAYVQNFGGRNELAVQDDVSARQLDTMILLLQEIAYRLALISGDTSSGRFDSAAVERSSVFNERFASNAA